MKVEELKVMAEEINLALGLDPAIKVNSRSTAAQLLEDIKSAVESFEGKASLSRTTIDALCEAEIDVPASISIGKGKKKTSGSKEPKAPKEKKVGVIATIESLLRASSKTAPITKEQILKTLTKTFPDKDPESMRKTINVQVPKRISEEKGLNIKKTEDGEFYV